jgi:hypothetical protein
LGLWFLAAHLVVHFVFSLISYEYTHNSKHYVQNITRKTENKTAFSKIIFIQYYFLAVNLLGYSLKVVTLVLILKTGTTQSSKFAYQIQAPVYSAPFYEWTLLFPCMQIINFVAAIIIAIFVFLGWHSVYIR